MSTLSPAMADPLSLLGHDLLLHLDETESLATQNAEWSEQDKGVGPRGDLWLVLIIREFLIAHERQNNGDRRICTSAWPTG